MNIFTLLIIGLFAGTLSGVFGIGGGFIMTPLLIFMGIPPAISVASSANQIIASSFSAFITHWKRRNVDIKMGIILIIGGFVGSSFGIWLFKLLQNFGQIDLVISLCYIVILGSIGISMFIESFRTILGLKTEKPSNPKPGLLSRLPLKLYFPHSNLKISIIVPIIVSIFSGILVSLMGIGGGFIMIPAMIYILRMPTTVVIGTSLFQVIFVTSNVTILHAVSTQSVDIILAGILLASSVIGAQFGSRIGVHIPADKIRALLAIMIVGVVLKLALGFFITPETPYQITITK